MFGTYGKDYAAYISRFQRQVKQAFWFLVCIVLNVIHTASVQCLSVFEFSYQPILTYEVPEGRRKFSPEMSGTRMSPWSGRPTTHHHSLPSGRPHSLRAQLSGRLHTCTKLLQLFSLDLFARSCPRVPEDVNQDMIAFIWRYSKHNLTLWITVESTR